MKWTPHPILKPPTDREMAAMQPEALIELHRLYHDAIENSVSDPYRYGFCLPHWAKAEAALDEVDEILALGGNRSGKTAWGARSVVRAAVENPGAEIFCFAQNSEVSIRQQQKAVWEWLPKEYKTKATSATAYISYTQKNGFTDGSLILPNGSQIIFKTYSQFQNNPTILEGAELGSRSPKWINVGCWLDEYLLGPDLIGTIRFRLATRNSKLLVTFTPIDGWTEVIREYLDGAETKEDRPAELLKGEKVPYVQRSKKRNASVHYFHSQDNPFGGYERIRNDLRNESRENILIRAYGVPTKSYTTKFPKFSTAVNVVSPEFIRDQIKRGATLYQIIDPAGRKNWFMCWIAVVEDGTWYVLREWPGKDVGEWAEQGGNGKWKPGPGAKGLGYGLRDYIEQIYQAEGREPVLGGEEWRGGEDIYLRLIDPRLGAQKYQKEDGDSCIIEDLNDLDFIVVPAPGDHIEDGLQKLVDLMAYDTAREVDGTNRPHFYVSSECENILQAIAEYTGEDGKDEAWKDPIDVLRYAAAYGIDHVERAQLAVSCRGRGGY